MKRARLEVIHQDDDIVVVNKPSGLLSIPDRWDKNLPNVRTMMAERFGEAFIVHRLDKETSGVMVFARNAEAHKHLSEQFEHRTADKIYHAVVDGIVSKDEFPIDIPLTHDSRRKGLMRPSARGKESLTEVTVLQRFRTASLLQCTIRTGRTHQIRVHCSAVGHPLLVDSDYGKHNEFMLSSIKRRYNVAKGDEERPIIDRLTLHSHTISLDHPTTGERVTYSADYPRDFAALIQVLTKYSAPYTSKFDF